MANETITAALETLSAGLNQEVAATLRAEGRAAEVEGALMAKAASSEGELQKQVSRNRVLSATLTQARGFVASLFGDPDVAGEAMALVADIDAALKVT